MLIEEVREAAANCKLCDLYSGRINPVFDKGNPAAPIFICGMVPAKQENEVGIPFVGRAGKLLDEILLQADLIDSVYITNLVKCFLAAGKPLQEEWIDNCLPYLISQITILKPKVIITLGKDASSTLLGFPKNTALSKILSGVEYKIIDGSTVVLPTYHPSYLLRKGGVKSPDFDSTVEIFKMAKKCIDIDD